MYSKKSWFVLALLVILMLSVQQALGQHGHHQAEESSGKDSAAALSLIQDVPMGRSGSGTSWLPDNAPMYGYMQHSKEWMYMLHGNFFLRYNSQDVFGAGSRGGDKVDALNWLMGMGQRSVGGRGTLRLSAMISLEPLTVGGEGYPLLFQTGETWQGEPMIDRQHPHDLFSELSVGYTHRLAPDTDLFAYVGYPGEPALGANVYMHRPSGMENPDSPLGHHWQDATHVTFGVVTLGLRYRSWKLDGSLFNGSEPDEDRYNFDEPRLNSYSGRLSFNPSGAVALQVSHAFLNSSEVSHQTGDVYRTSASVNHALSLGTERFLSTALIWGYNYLSREHKEHSLLLESAYQMRSGSIYSRLEWVQKSAEELGLFEPVIAHGTLVPVTAVTVGLSRTLLHSSVIRFSIGAQGSVYFTDDRLADTYGKAPVAGQLYLRISPRLMSASAQPVDEMMDH